MADFSELQVLGQGAFGRVFRAWRRTDGVHYALKEVRVQDLSEQERTSAVGEVHLLAQMDSPSIVRYYDAFHADSNLFSHERSAAMRRLL